VPGGGTPARAVHQTSICGAEGRVIENLALRDKGLERKRQEKRLRHPGQNKPGMVGETEAAIVRRLAEQYAAGGAASAQQRQAMLDQAPPDALFLERRKYRNRPQPLPSVRAVGNGHR